MGETNLNEIAMAITEHVAINIETVNELIMDATTRGDSYRVLYTRVDDWNFEQRVEGEGICEFCGDELDKCTCEKVYAILHEDTVVEYINNLFATEDDILLIVNGTKYKRKH